jgi:hypothetical protein
MVSMTVNNTKGTSVAQVSPFFVQEEQVIIIIFPTIYIHIHPIFMLYLCYTYTMLHLYTYAHSMNGTYIFIHIVMSIVPTPFFLLLFFF